MFALITAGEHISTQAYWRELSGDIVRAELDSVGNTWEPAASIVKGMTPGTQFSAIHWGAPVRGRLYYQRADGAIAELTSSDGGGWFPGSVVVSPMKSANAAHASDAAVTAPSSKGSCVIA